MDTQKEWPADAYAIGSYIQATVANHYIEQLHIKPTAKLLDVGCGNGAYSKQILAKVPQGSILGIDSSESMLQLAQEVALEHPNFFIKNTNVLDMYFDEQFDAVVSFWCLQWTSTAIQHAFANMCNVLKKGGQLFTLFPAGDDPYILSYYALKESGQFKSLEDFQPMVDYSKLNNLEQQLAPLPFQNLNVTRLRESILLPSLDVFRKFVSGIAFYQGQIPDGEIKELNEAMVSHYEQECATKYQGQYQFNFSIYLITGTK
jgi:ubiquinone/menaquinone biosynthesis C-methylase UbiE